MKKKVRAIEFARFIVRIFYCDVEVLVYSLGEMLLETKSKHDLFQSSLPPTLVPVVTRLIYAGNIFRVNPFKLTTYRFILNSSYTRGKTRI